MLVTDHPLATIIISRVVRGWSEGGQHLRNGVTMVVSLLLLRSMIERNNRKLTTMVTMVRGWSPWWLGVGDHEPKIGKPRPRSEGTAGGSLWWMGS